MSRTLKQQHQMLLVVHTVKISKSVIGSFYTLSACVDQISNVTLNDWQANNTSQQKYLEIYKLCTGAKIPEIESKVSIGDIAPINAFLRQHGFNIQLATLKDPRSLAIASTLEVLLKWLAKGKKTTVHYQRVKYQAVDLSVGVEVRNFDGFTRPVAVVTCKNGDKVYITIPSTEPKDSFEVYEMARKLLASESALATEYEGRVVFPMVDLDVQPDISWIIGLSDEQEKWKISQALQQTKVTIDKEGVIIREAVAMGFETSAPPESPLIIDEPFLFVIKREGLKAPLFSAYLSTDGWQTDRG